MRTVAVAIAALALGGCFRSERALLSESEAVAPIADGAVYEFRPSDGADDQKTVVRFVRAGSGYELRATESGEAIGMRLMFAEITQTPEQDYVAQIEMGADDRAGYQYWFIWSTGENRYRIQTQAVGLDDEGHRTSDPCAAELTGCAFTSSGDLIKHYLDAVYPVFSRGRSPSTYSDAIPVDEAIPD